MNESQEEEKLSKKTTRAGAWSQKRDTSGATKMLQVDLEKLNADIAASLDRLRGMLDDCNAVAGHVAEVRNVLREMLQKGVEGRSFSVTLSNVLVTIQTAHDLYTHVLAFFKE